MSGGAYNYAYQTVLMFAEALRNGVDSDGDDVVIMLDNAEKRKAALELRQQFAAHLDKVAEAMRAIEWTDSGDSNVDDEAVAIRACLTDWDFMAEAKNKGGERG